MGEKPTSQEPQQNEPLSPAQMVVIAIMESPTGRGPTWTDLDSVTELAVFLRRQGLSGKTIKPVINTGERIGREWIGDLKLTIKNNILALPEIYGEEMFEWSSVQIPGVDPNEKIVREWSDEEEKIPKIFEPQIQDIEKYLNLLEVCADENSVESVENAAGQYHEFNSDSLDLEHFWGRWDRHGNFGANYIQIENIERLIQRARELQGQES